MTAEIPLTLGGPVLHWELIRSTRRTWPYVLRYLYAGWLFLQFVIMIAGFAASVSASEKTVAQMMPGDPLPKGETPGERFIRFSGDYISLYLQQQIVLLVLVAPAVTAGALGHEKERGTLQALFGTELQSFEMVLGKLLGRLTILLQLTLVGLPLYLLMGGFAGIGMGRLLLGLLQGYLVGFVFAGAAMLASVWTRQTRDAILACYAMVTLVLLSVLTVLGDIPLPSWVNPLEVCQREFSPPFPDIRPIPLLLHFLVWFGAGMTCVGLSIWRLRHACLTQLEGTGRQRLRVLFWFLRPAVRGNPVRWRETHIIGLAPLPWLRMVPKWMAMLGVLAFSTILLLSAMSAILGQGFFPALRTFDFALLRSEFGQYDPGRVYEELIVMGVILLFLGPLVVAVRCAGSISEEKRRKTWEDLVVTPLTFDEIVQGKMWGVLSATTPYLFMYALPMLGLGLMASAGGVAVTLLFLAGTWFAMFLAASLGMAYSAGELQGKGRAHWRSDGQTLIDYLQRANQPPPAA